MAFRPLKSLKTLPDYLPQAGTLQEVTIFFPASTQLINPNQHTVSYVLLCMFYKVGVLENSEEVLLFVLHQGGTLIFIIG